MNRLLKRQIRRYLGNLDDYPPEIHKFLEAVDRSYDHYEQDRQMLENVMDISSEELTEANAKLIQEAENQRTLLKKLKSSLNTILSISDTYANIQIDLDEDILGIVDLMESQLQKIKETEDELRLIMNFIDRSSDAIEVADTDGKLVFVNQKASEWIGLTKAELKEKPVYEVDNKFRGKESWTRLSKGLDQAEHILLKRTQNLPNKNNITVETNVTKLQINNSDYIIGVSRDISEREKAQKEQQRLLAKMQDINQELENFAYIVSHDLKAPLRGISSITMWLVEDYKDSLDEDGQELVELLQKRVERMHGLIEGILQYSRIDRKDTTAKALDLQEIVQDVIEFVAPPEHIKVSMTTPFPTIFNHETQVRQLFQNFLSNAIKYNDKKQGIVEVSCQEVEDDMYEFCVADNGPGIEKKYQEKIFQIFQTLHKKDEYNSTGIGLSIVKKIISNNGGKIRVESEKDQGAKFYFTLPKKVEEEQ